jgi:hypothetical protein
MTGTSLTTEQLTGAATTGVKGLEAIIPIAPNTSVLLRSMDWFDLLVDIRREDIEVCCMFHQQRR